MNRNLILLAVVALMVLAVTFVPVGGAGTATHPASGPGPTRPGTASRPSPGNGGAGTRPTTGPSHPKPGTTIRPTSGTTPTKPGTTPGGGSTRPKPGSSHPNSPGGSITQPKPGTAHKTPGTTPTGGGGAKPKVGEPSGKTRPTSSGHRPSGGPSVAKIPPTVKPPTASGNTRVKVTDYAPRYGVKLKNGYYGYRGIDHRHWSRKYYSPQWRCWCWFCPSTDQWYYWCGDRDLYLPVRYLVVVPPTVAEEESTAELPPDASEVPQTNESEVPNLPEP